MDRLVLYGSFTSSSSYKPMLYLALARLPFSFRTVQPQDRRAEASGISGGQPLGVVPSLRHRGLTILQSNVILDYLARETGTSRAEPSNSAGWRASGCRGKPTTLRMSPRCATRHGFFPNRDVRKTDRRLAPPEQAEGNQRWEFVF
jgi:hypothetical protein